MLITEGQGYLIRSIQEQMTKMGYNVILVRPIVDEISKVTEPVLSAIIYTDSNVTKYQKAWIYVKDKCAEEDIRLFMIGGEEDVEEIEGVIPKHLMQAIFTRPIDVSEAVKRIDNDIKQYGKQNKKKILVVDDSGAALRSVKAWLENKYHVILANSGVMAIKYLALNRPDLILLDYEMPVVDGKQVLEMIRAEEAYRDIPVFFLTSKGDKQSVQNVLALKPQGYLLKTMAPDSVIKLVDEFFAKQEASLQETVETAANEMVEEVVEDTELIIE